jgi:putative glycosyltransferase (TIGR04372 family)
MDARIMRLPFRRTLLARPRHHALGLLIVDVLISLHVARAGRVPLALLRGERGEDSPLLRLVAADVVRVDNMLVRARLASRLWTAVLWIFRAARELRYPRNHAISALLTAADVSLWVAAWLLHAPRDLRRLSNTLVRRVEHALLGGIETSAARGGWRMTTVRVLDHLIVGKFVRLRNWRESLLEQRAGLSTRLEGMRRPTPPGREVHHGFDVRELSATRPLSVRLSHDDEAHAERVAASLGLVGVPLVSLHVRDGGSKRDTATGGWARDMARDARIESYLEAVDALVARGFTVVRIGDSGMAPIARTGLVDLATHPEHSLLLDLWAVRHSRFFIAGDSGPYMLSWLFNVPCLAVNITNVSGVFPLRPTDLYLVKRLQDLTTGRMIPLSEMLTGEFLGLLRRRLHKEQTLRYVDNDSDDIRDAAIEMAEGLEQLPAETPLQAEYRQRIALVRQSPAVRAKLHEKAGLEEVFLGDGRVSRAFVARHYHAGMAAHTR